MISKKIFPAAVLLLFLLIAPEAAHAQISFGDTASKFFGGMIEVFTVLNWLALAVVQALLNPDFIFGAKLASGVRPMELILNQIWIVSRDIVNGIFAFMLLAFGVYMIVAGAEKGVGAMLKEKAPKFVLAVVLVNFSWFFPRVILDMANVGQAVIYQLPTLVVGPSTRCISAVEPGPDGVKGTGDDVKKLCDFVWKVRLFPPTADKCTKVPAPPGCPRPKSDSPFPLRGQQLLIVDIYYTDWEKAVGGKFENGSPFPVSGADTVINGLAVNFAKMPQLARVEFERAGLVSGTHGDLTGKARAYLKFFVYLAFAAILSMAIGLILLAFAAVLLVRVAVIWMCVAFMPFIFVGYAWKGALGDLGNEKAPNIWQKFIKYALIPVFVAIPLSVGFTLLSFSGYLSNFSALNMAGSIEVVGMEHVITGITEIHELIWMLLTLGIIWTGTFAVLESDEYSAKIVGGIKGFGEGTMNMAKRSALYAPIIPFPGKGGGMLGVGDFLDATRGASHGRGFSDFDDILAGRARGGGGGSGGGRVAVAPPSVADVEREATGMNPTQFQDLKRLIQNTNSNPASSQQNLDQLVQKIVDSTNGRITREQARGIFTDTDAEPLKALARKSGVITETEAMQARDKFRNINAQPPVNNIDIRITTGMGTPEAKKESATKAYNALHSNSRSIDQVKQALQASIDDPNTQHLPEVGIQEVLDTINRIHSEGTRAAKTQEQINTELLAALTTLKA